MIFGGPPFTGAPFGGGSFVDTSSPAPFTTHLLKKDREDIYLLEAYPRLKIGGFAGTPILTRYLDREWIGKPFIPVRMARALDFEGSVDARFAGGGGGIPKVGEIRIVGNTRNDFEFFDTAGLRNRTWDGARIVIKLGAPDFTLGQFGIVFSGRSSDLLRDATGYDIVIGDPSIGLATPIHDAPYAGTGGIEGDTSVANTWRPYGAGIVRNATPVLIDRTNYIYQFNTGSSESLDAIYEYADEGFIDDGPVADIFAGSPPAAGHYRYELGRSFFQLGAPASSFGAITCDFHGDNVGGYVETVADIVDRLCRRFASYVDSDFDLASFSQLNTDRPQPIGIYLGQTNPNVIDVVSQLLGQGNPVGMPLTFKTWTRLGELRVGAHKFRTPVRTITRRQIVDARRSETQAAFWHWTLGWGANWTPQRREDLFPGATAAQAEFVERDFRTVIWEDTDVRDDHGRPNRVQINTLIDDETDAQDIADAAGALTSADRDFHEIGVIEHQYLIDEGDTVSIGSDVLDEAGIEIDAGDYLVLGLGENSDTQITKLKLWG